MSVTRDYVSTRIKRAALAISTLGLLVLFTGVAIPQIAHGQDDQNRQGQERDRKGMEKCQQRTQKAEGRLTEEMREHGNHSRQANHAWMELRAQRERCYTAYHQWWNGRDQQWRQDNGWDRDPRGDDRDNRDGGHNHGGHLQ
jgi:hypothetical protein